MVVPFRRVIISAVLSHGHEAGPELGLPLATMYINVEDRRGRPRSLNQCEVTAVWLDSAASLAMTGTNWLCNEA